MGLALLGLGVWDLRGSGFYRALGFRAFFWGLGHEGIEELRAFRVTTCSVIYCLFVFGCLL